MDERLLNALNRWGCRNPRPLLGEAGARKYFRVDHSHLGTALIVLYPEADPLKPDDPYYDYRALQAYLDPVVRVPTTIQYCDEDRTMLVEDIGDMSLEQRLMQHPEEEVTWAAEVGSLLVTWMGLLTEGAPSRSFFMLRSFDREKFNFEWEYCHQNFFQDFLQKDPPKWLDRLMEDLHSALVNRARFLAHRDFQVRNLLVRGDHLVTIDFQDARRGAATYDLASILFDGYWDWSEEAGSVLIEQTREAMGWSEALLWEELNLSAIQRNLKNLGTYGHQVIHRKRSQFASAIPRTIRHLIRHFQRLRHGEGVIATERWLHLAEERLLSCREG